MSDLLYNKFDQTPLTTEPFECIVVPGFVRRQALDAARASYPEVPGPGSHPPANLDIRDGFKALVEELLGPQFQFAIEKKFDIDLLNRPTMYTVRGSCRARDGKIHTDSKTKIITVLLYMNDDEWSSETGRLRLLRSGTDLEDYFMEVEPAGGTLIAFKRSDKSWHGHHSFEGRRRAIQLNWVTDQSVVDREQSRHSISTRLKRLFSRNKM